MSQRNGKPKIEDAKPVQVQVPRPVLRCFATTLGVNKSRHNAIGDCCTLTVEAGDLEIQVSFPLEFTGEIGKELVQMQGGVILSDGLDLEKLKKGDVTP